jgi:N-acylneuraminate cytidylyltransferase
MLEKKSIVAIVPARGGSKGILRKNLRQINGRSLLAHTIATAKQSQWIDKIIVSSEDQEIIQAAQQAGAEVPFTRPIELAADETPGTQPILHALSQLPFYDYVIVLQTTSPLRNAKDIDECLNFIVAKQAPACVSVCQADISPHWMFKLNAQHQLKQLLADDIPMRRQDLPPTFYLNGAIYAAQTDWFLKNKSFLTAETIAYIMPRARSIDVDTEYDLRLAEWMLADAC